MQGCQWMSLAKGLWYKMSLPEARALPACVTRAVTRWATTLLIIKQLSLLIRTIIPCIVLQLVSVLIFILITSSVNLLWYLMGDRQIAWPALISCAWWCSIYAWPLHWMEMRCMYSTKVEGCRMDALSSFTLFIGHTHVPSRFFLAMSCRVRV